MSDAIPETTSTSTSTAITLVFGFERTNIHAVAEGVARVLNIQFEPHDSSFIGSYYKYPANRGESETGYKVWVKRNQVKLQEFWNEPEYKAFRVILRLQDVEARQVEGIKTAIHQLRKNKRQKAYSSINWNRSRFCAMNGARQSPEYR